MRLIKYTGFNILFFALMYFAYIEEIEGAENVLLFFAWFGIVVSFFLNTEPLIESIKENIKKKPRAIKPEINIIIDIVGASIFVWFGAWITGIFWIIHLFLTEAAFSRALDEIKKSNDTEARA